MNFKQWLRKLVSAVIKGGAHAGGAWLGLAVANVSGANVPILDYKSLEIIVVTSGMLQLFVFLESNPLPDDDSVVVKVEEKKP